MPLLCWHYTPSLLPWNYEHYLAPYPWRQLREGCESLLLVDLHVQFVLHNWENTESLWQCSAVSTENAIHVSCNGTIAEHVVEDGCFSSAPASVILTHYIIAVDLATAPTLTFSAVPEAHSWPVRGAKEKCLTCPLSCWWRHCGILLQTPSSPLLLRRVWVPPYCVEGHHSQEWQKPICAFWTVSLLI